MPKNPHDVLAVNLSCSNFLMLPATLPAAAAHAIPVKSVAASRTSAASTYSHRCAATTAPNPTVATKSPPPPSFNPPPNRHPLTSPSTNSRPCLRHTFLSCLFCRPAMAPRNKCKSKTNYKGVWLHESGRYADELQREAFATGSARSCARL